MLRPKLIVLPARVICNLSYDNCIANLFQFATAPPGRAAEELTKGFVQGIALAIPQLTRATPRCANARVQQFQTIPLWSRESSVHGLPGHLALHSGARPARRGVSRMCRET